MERRERTGLPDRAAGRRIVPLERARWAGWRLPIAYETEEYYDVSIRETPGGFAIALEKRPAQPPIRHGQAEYGDPDRLYQPWWEGAEAYGIVEDGALLAAVEVCPEEYANRLRVTELWVDARLRRQGVGSRLMDLAKAVAAQDGRRAVVLETQSCNAAAIAFYRSQGFTLNGFDRSCYGNDDVQRREVRLDLVFFL